jgi:hypothetical protein
MMCANIALHCMKSPAHLSHVYCRSTPQVNIMQVIIIIQVVLIIIQVIFSVIIQVTLK